MKFLRRFHLKSVVGSRGEDAAAEFLRKEGWTVLERNYRNRSGKALGEIDIVARDGDTIVFVEVKARNVGRAADIYPESAIRAEKIRRLGRIGELWMKERGEMDRPCRFDALAITLEGTETPRIRHIRNIHI